MTESGIGPTDRTKLALMHGTSTITPNYRDASNSSRTWKQPPTPIDVPTQRRSSRNPWRFNNNLTPGNPIKNRTLLNSTVNGSTLPYIRPPKRQKMDSHHISPITSPFFNASKSNGKASSSTRSAAPLHDSEPEIQEVLAPISSRKRQQRHSYPNDAEIMIVDGPSEDIGQPISRIDIDKSGDRSSPDPIAMSAPSRPPPHAFETRPGQLHLHATSSKTAKDRDVDVSNRPVSPSESEDEIEPCSSEFQDLPSLKSPAIPPGIVKRNRRAFEGSEAPVVSRTAKSQRGVPALNLVDISQRGPTIASRMKRKDQGLDPTLLPSGLVDSRRKKDAKLSLPLEVLYFGHAEFSRESDHWPLKLEYEDRNKTLVISVGQPPRKFPFKLNRDVDSVKITNDNEEPLRENVVIQFETTKGTSGGIKKLESDYRGLFQGGGSRSLGTLTFVFSTDHKLGWSITPYQEFANFVRLAIPSREVIRPSAGRSLWEQAKNIAEMASQQQAGPRHKESGVGPSTHSTRSSTPSTSSVKTKGSESVLKPPDTEVGPPELRRSLRQSIAQSAKAPLPPPPAAAEPDELVLVYPPGTGALNIMRSDLKRLGPEEYLNDTLIEFGLKLWLNDLREKDPALADQIHVFSSFFYKKLNKKNPEEGYQSVRKWTSKVDLFSKKYIIVPINENVHWYFAIIYGPGHSLEPPFAPPPSSPSRTTRRQTKEQKKVNVETGFTKPRPQIQDASTSSAQEGDSSTSSKEATRATTPSVTQDEEMEDVTAAAVKLTCSDSASVKPASKSNVRATSAVPSELMYPPSSPTRGHAMDVDTDKTFPEFPVKPSVDFSKEIFGATSDVPVTRFYGRPLLSKKADKTIGDAVVVVDSEDEENERQQEAEVDDMLAVSQSQPSPIRPSQTYIFTLDSLGTKHPQAIKVLRHYLAREARDKRGFDEVRDAIGKQVHVPSQPNTWDCGIYLLHLTKVFMDHPQHYFHLITTAKGTIPASDRKSQWKDYDVPRFRDYLASRITQLSEAWKADKVAKDGDGKKRKSEEVEAEVISSEGEVDIVDVSGEIKTKPQSVRHAVRLRG